jgi:hypothetical protein
LVTVAVLVCGHPPQMREPGVTKRYVEDYVEEDDATYR